MRTGPENKHDLSLVLVCGAARSGTTMLDLMLGNTDEAFSCGEIYALFRPFRTHHFDPVCSCGSEACPVWKNLRNVSEQQFHKLALRESKTRFVIDSSKDLRWVLDSNGWATENGILVRNVLIWKDPIDLAHSHWKRGRPIGYFRKQFLDYYERFLNLDLPFVGVRYADLVANPVAILEPLCAELGMQYSPGRERFWEKQHHHFFGSAGTARQVEDGSSTVALKRDFPESFMQAFEAFTAGSPDQRMLSVVAQLEANDLFAPGRQRAAGLKRTGLRPGWYYRHILKAMFRRRFPERTPVID